MHIYISMMIFNINNEQHIFESPYKGVSIPNMEIY